MKNRISENEPDFPPQVEAAFRAIVVAHLRALPAAEYKKFRSYSAGGSPYLQQLQSEGDGHSEAELVRLKSDIGRLLKPEVLFDSYKASDGCITIVDSIAGRDYVAIGEIVGQPVVFLPASGEYYYSTAPDYPFVLALWISGTHYPPGY